MSFNVYKHIERLKFGSLYKPHTHVHTHTHVYAHTMVSDKLIQK